MPAATQTFYTLRYGVHGACNVREIEFTDLATAKAKGLRWSQSNSLGHYWAQVVTDGRIIAQWN